MKKLAKRRRASKSARAAKTSPHLQLSHRRHTGHILSRRSTSYPTLAMILLCAGVFLAGWTHFATADSSGAYTITTSVLGSAPTQAATIDSPTNGTVFTSQPITVSGTCPTATYETLYRNGAFSGVVLCDGSGHYSLQTGMFPGINQLQVRDFNLADVPGPLSNLVTVTYQPPNGTPAVNTNTSANSGSAPTKTLPEPLIFKTTYTFQGHYTNQSTTWQLDLEGGTVPYSISVDWGDGSHSLLSRPSAGVFSMTHTYQKPGGYRGNYVVTFSASDAKGQQTFLQLMTIVNNPPPGAAATTSHRGSAGTIVGAAPGFLQQLFHYVWPVYLLIILLLTSFWLGERREYHHLRPQLKKAGRA